MKIIYIHHSTFCVEIEDRVLVFDYYNGVGVPSFTYHGKMPEYPRETPIYVFSSHSHRDHFDMEVLKWRERYPNIHYIFAKEIKKKLGNSVFKRLGVTEEDKTKITYVKPGETYEIADLKVQTLLSTDSGVAYLVSVCGKVIYHAGDLNWWHWEEESEEFNRWQEETYKQQIKLLNGRKIDLSFVTVDPRLGNNQFLGIDFFMQQVKTGYVLPMHLWKHYELIKQYRQKPENSGWRERILTVDRENQEIVV